MGGMLGPDQSQQASSWEGEERGFGGGCYLMKDFLVPRNGEAVALNLIGFTAGTDWHLGDRFDLGRQHFHKVRHFHSNKSL